MAGLLDFLPQDPNEQRALFQGLLSGAFGAMNGRGSKLQAWGQGGLAGLSGYGNELERQGQAKVRDQQLKRGLLQDQLLQGQVTDQQRQAAQAKAQQDWLASLQSPQQQAVGSALSGGGGPTVANAAKMPQVDPAQQMMFEAVQKGVLPVQSWIAAQQKDTTPIAVKEGESLLDRKTFKPIFQNHKDDAPADWKLYQLAGGDAKYGSFDRWDLARKQAGATSVNTYGSPLPIDLGNGRTGYLQPPTRPGGPTQVLGIPGGGAAYKPMEAGQTNKVEDAKDALGLVDMADKLLTGGATGSYLGKARDFAAGAVGYSTPGSESAAKLKVIQGMLVSKMPKMSGPQSDKDVVLYQQMAGLVGDDTIPVERRKAALKAVRAIQEKYAASPTGKQSGGATGTYGTVDFGDLK